MKGNEILTKPEDSGLQVTLDELFEDLTDEQNRRILGNQDLPDWLVYRIRILEPIVKSPGYVNSGEVWRRLRKEFRETLSLSTFKRSWHVIESYVRTGKHPGDAKKPAVQPAPVEQNGKIVRPKSPISGQ